LRKFLEMEGVAEYFDLMLFSDEVGIRKPDPRIFSLITKKMKVKPWETAHVGDNLRIDVWGAKNAVFKAIYFSSDAGRDKIAEADPTSLVSLSRRLGNLSKDQVVPDKTITSLITLMEVVKELET